MTARKEASALKSEHGMLWANAATLASDIREGRMWCASALADLRAKRSELRELQKRIGALSLAPGFNVPEGIRAVNDAGTRAAVPSE